MSTPQIYKLNKYTRMRVYTLITATKRHQMISLMLLLVAMLSGCASEKAETEIPVSPVVIEEPQEPESMSLAFACIPSVSNAGTRLDNGIVQLNNAESYRAINTNDIHFVALKKNESGAITSVANSEIDKQESADKTNARYYHFSYCDMPQGTNGCLVYAKADDKVQTADDPETAAMKTKIYNGSLKAVIPDGFNLTATSDIYFEPEPIYPDATVVPAEATALADAMTGVVNALWRASNNVLLQNLLGNFTNHGFNLPGSAASVKTWLKALSDAAQAYLDNPPAAIDDAGKDILRQIQWDALAAANNITLSATSYPKNLNLPDGAATIRWVDSETGKKFEPQLQTTPLDDINTVSRFVYPPALYYFVESGIRTSTASVTFNDYKEGYSTWAAVLDAKFPTTNPHQVEANTKTVAIEDPLQYAVARLALKVKADAVNLKYREGEGNTISIKTTTEGVTTNYFRLTGVIVSGQRLVNYQFKPASNLDSDMKFVYDTQVGNDFYLTTTAFDDANAKEFNTLLLQSCDGEDVKVILEFEYTGTQEFKCLNGYVYPNTRFYLVGELKMKDITPVDQNNPKDHEKRVFTQDYTTSVEMTVKTLEKAYNVLPSILAKNLEIGVQTTPKWVAVKPTGPVIMD